MAGRGSERRKIEKIVVRRYPLRVYNLSPGVLKGLKVGEYGSAQN